MILDQLINIFFPRKCVLCNKFAFQIDICDKCWQKLPRNLSTEIFAPFKYQTPISDFILGLKFGEKLPFARLLSDLMIEPLFQYYKDRQKPEVIIPVPLHKKRLQERGFNQALEIAHPLAKKIQIPIDFNFVRRIKNTLAQAQLAKKDREINIKNAFAINKHHKKNYQHIALIDDVITTGNTINELCKELRQNGIKKIDILCAAKT